jgi:hypothetical protein
MKIYQLGIICAVLAVTLVFAGCTSSAPASAPAATMAPSQGTPAVTGTPGSMTTMMSSSGSAPAVSITSPMDGATVTGSDVPMTIQINNFAITPESTDKNNMKGMMQNMAGTGHIHWFIDVPAPTDTSKKAETAPGTWKMHDDVSYTFTNVTPGTHTLSVELVNNDMTPLASPIYKTITVAVK